MKENYFVQSSQFRNVLTICHSLDGVAAFVIGLGLYFQHVIIVTIGILVITKFCLIHLMNRMILAHKKGDVTTMIEGFIQTTKSFLHHVASFIFLSQPEEIIITTVWRTVSMSGHAILALRGRISPDSQHTISVILSYLRIFTQLSVLVACLVYPSIQAQFARSAVGHIAYMMVRMGPVFNQGGPLITSTDKEQWTSLSNRDRVSLLLSGHHVWLTVELGLLAAMIAYFSVLRAAVLVDDLSSGSAGIVTAPDMMAPLWNAMTSSRTALVGMFLSS